ncbi:class-II fumarase/aspartase family protein [Companilactobacillus sp.]|jgi:adenylosuccinate lyase|uniref:class-II fumarase/aspartase family protein n=1 Tax=Companilactobacillus sp. TaxID=2767905 RepID=UPI0025C0196E|nr:adenylosuccinate lyase family protein [Companilactobacillus sp.]MCH4009524.1 adenylosuccinate lyase family protein [Companilactobacillus sp.]MCH4052800.1 adenylosuccinate lyase family protein [Companilactobacillus sp.]MCH4077466.1 adenylosuccinate lyase family protein [Companilactobacillus sp.]MCH4126042.1 adenylosuccinate lyase family protein [Companilactobacillus sp.]MCI1311750.1 adenylosuccinate lyase family protein [Companilactobacillus sp.]
MTDVLDSQLLQNNFSTEKMRSIWNDNNKITQQLKIEAALSKIEGQLQVIPQSAADKIVAQAKIENFDIEELAKESAKKRHSLIALINHLQALAGPEAGEFVHYGATTQDIVDTGTMLQTKQAYELLREHGRQLIKTLKYQTQRYRSTLMIGRTHGIQAIPITFGFKLAIWLDELIRDQKRLDQLAEEDIFVGSLNGAVGTYAAFGPKGPEIERLALGEIGLQVPSISWQPSRDRFSEFASVLGIYSGTLGKIGHELYNLMRTEVNEINEPFVKGEVGSSTMPQKRNPALIEGLTSLTQPIFKDVGLMLESMLIEGERDAIHWRNEWVVLPEITNYLDAQLTNANYIIEGLKVNEQQMFDNIQLQNGLPFAERIMFQLGTVVGKQTAHKLVYDSAMAAIEQNKNFIDVLYLENEVNSNFSKDEVIAWTDAKQDIGSIEEKIDQVLQKTDSVFQTTENVPA